MPALRRHALFAAIALLASCGGPPKAQKRKELTAREIVQRYKPAIVRIENDLGLQHGAGTGFFVTPGGRIATNLHVIFATQKLTVKLSDGTEHEVKRVVGMDQQRDLAIIEIDAPGKMPTVPLGNSDGVAPGDAVIAIGNPMNLDYTVSDGLISSVRPVEDDVILQISAPISQGSSGGPLFNAFGEVIGVATAVSKKGQNLNFGVPVNYLRPLIAHPSSITVAEFAEQFAPPPECPEPSVIQSDVGDIRREVPCHAISLLKGCNPDEIMKVFQGINRAIQLGAPLYNDGDHEACFNIYKQTASHFEKDDGVCKGLRDAFGDGLLKADTAGDFTRKAWVMRDTFDGILSVVFRTARKMSGQDGPSALTKP